MARRELLLRDADAHDLTQLGEYESVGGYKWLRKALGMTRKAVLDELLAADVRGRGGAGFPMGRKASFLPQPEDTPKPIYLVANADESEPGTFKDREILIRAPHLFIEGVVIAAHTIGSSHAFIYLRGEYLAEFEIMKAALEDARQAGYVGTDVLGSGWDLTIVVHRGAGAYICGEETGLLESLEGHRGQPRTKPPFPAVSGLYASPTLINNVETLSTVPRIVEMGGAAYARIGVEHSAGTRIFSISGNVANGGNYELELGTSLREFVYDIGGGIPDGRELKAIIPGGSSVPVMNASEVDTPLDFDSMAEAGTMLGSGAVIVIDDRCCMVQLGLRVAQFYMHESCGKCTPCREGTWWLVQVLAKLERGIGTEADLDLLLDQCDNIMGRSFCALADGAVSPIQSSITYFRDEYLAHLTHGGCPFDPAASTLFAPAGALR
jgi:NADH-quinone oxidoreductase subunit F